MSIDELDKILAQANDDFSKEMHLQYKEGSNNPVTEADLHELARQAYYVFDSYRENIIKYLHEL